MVTTVEQFDENKTKENDVFDNAGSWNIIQFKTLSSYFRYHFSSRLIGPSKYLLADGWYLWIIKHHVE
jgi:hypothetical protein